MVKSIWDYEDFTNTDMTYDELTQERIGQIIAAQGGIKGWADDHFEDRETKRERGQLIEITVDGIPLEIDATSSRYLEDTAEYANETDYVEMHTELIDEVAYRNSVEVNIAYTEAMDAQSRHSM